MVDALHKTKSSIKQLVIPGMLFENMGLTYLGPVDGHDMRQLGKVIAGRQNGSRDPVLIHVLTEKGRGYEPAMRHPARFHGQHLMRSRQVFQNPKEIRPIPTIFSTVCEIRRPGTGCSGRYRQQWYRVNQD